ncbi:MAG: hypothetical protein EBU23_15315 [Mycobacteriaceae bacterium]|nr:hypothetical protein [Mycobacteriaceae bacterium]
MSDDDYDEYDDASDVVSDVEEVEAEEAEVAEEAKDSDEDAASDSDEDAASTAPPPDRAERAAGPRGREDPTVREANTPVRVIVVPQAERITDNRLQKFEAAHVLAVRAQQIASTGLSFAKARPEGPLLDPYHIAFYELNSRQCPLILRRQVGTGNNGEIIVEEWHVNEMTLPPLRAPY